MDLVQGRGGMRCLQSVKLQENHRKPKLILPRFVLLEMILTAESESTGSDPQVTAEPNSKSWGLSEIPMHVGSALIRPEDRGKIRSTALASAEHQARQQMDLLRRQAEHLMEEARQIEARLLLSIEIFQADVNFVPTVGKVYHLYQRTTGSRFLSLIAPDQWGRLTRSLEHRGSFRHLADHTWEPV